VGDSSLRGYRRRLESPTECPDHEPPRDWRQRHGSSRDHSNERLTTPRYTSPAMPAKLLIVGTPIGNLSDFPPRAIEALKSAALILCEDTRHTRKLLNHFGIERPTTSFHEHNEDAKAAAILDRVAAGETIAMVSDAGMPIVSDP